MNRVITIKRQYGRGTGGIARKLGLRLEWQLWDKTLTEEVACRMDCDREIVEERRASVRSAIQGVPAWAALKEA